MNKKGFTLVELILVITLMAVISVLVIPNILDALSSSKQQKYESLYKLVEKNMKLYNDKYSVDLWNNENTSFDFCEGDTQGCNSGIDKLKESGGDLNLDDCKINYMNISKSDDNYTYNLELICNTNDSDENEWVYCTRQDNKNIKCGKKN